MRISNHESRRDLAYTVQNTVFRILIQDAHLESQFKIRTLPCENSLGYFFSNLSIFVLLEREKNLIKIAHFPLNFSNKRRPSLRAIYRVHCSFIKFADILMLCNCKYYEVTSEQCTNKF